MTQAQLEKESRETACASPRRWKIYWQRPLTAEQLQAEMESNWRSTPNSRKCCRSSFDALGKTIHSSSPECVARPALAERLVTNWYAHDERIHGDLKQRAEAELQGHPAVEQMKTA